MTARPNEVSIDTSDIDKLLSGVGRRNEAKSAVQKPTDGTTVQRQNGKTAAKPSKFTVLLEEKDALAFDMLAYEMRAAAGRRVEKAEILRTLIQLALSDVRLNTSLGQTLDRRPVQTEQPAQD
ncbi:hypothetical protein [Streptomyces sp. NPDC058621]|uniref:hypothetical protein n=1 Tax=Streptomyces sp. NPDC058621 TaxID=3346561 RepID=UPI00366402CA